jgi:hypothetical protein
MLRSPALLIVLFFASGAFADEKTEAVQQLIPWLLDETAALKGVPFRDVILATSGKQVIPIGKTDADDQRVLAQIGTIATQTLAEMNAPESKTRGVRRVNEMSSPFENALQKWLNAVPGLACDFPKTAAGKYHRSGYPDLRLFDHGTKRVYYLDPKLYAKGSRTSSFRAFYFEPKRETNKVTDDARHLIIGIEHERRPDGTVKFTRWELIDLSGFRVKLKAEFEGSNADMYRRDAVVGSGTAVAPTP